MNSCTHLAFGISDFGSTFYGRPFPFLHIRGLPFFSLIHMEERALFLNATAPGMEPAHPSIVVIESMPATKTLHLSKLYIVEYIFLKNIYNTIELM